MLSGGRFPFPAQTHDVPFPPRDTRERQGPAWSPPLAGGEAPPHSAWSGHWQDRLGTGWGSLGASGGDTWGLEQGGHTRGVHEAQHGVQGPYPPEVQVPEGVSQRLQQPQPLLVALHLRPAAEVRPGQTPGTLPLSLAAWVLPEGRDLLLTEAEGAVWSWGRPRAASVGRGGSVSGGRPLLPRACRVCLGLS